MAQTNASKEAQAKKAAEAKAAEETATEVDAAQDAADAEKAAAVVKGTKPVAHTPLSEPEEGLEWFENKGDANIYTTRGRCMPNNRIQLDPEEAKNYKGIEPCQ